MGAAVFDEVRAGEQRIGKSNSGAEHLIDRNEESGEFRRCEESMKQSE